MNFYWIFEREDSPQGFPLGRLIKLARKYLCADGCTFFLRRVWGYGEQIYEWEELLADRDTLEVSAEEFERLVVEAEEWFYGVEVECVTPTTTVRFGVHDSSALFLEAPPQWGDPIVAQFRDVRVESR